MLWSINKPFTKKIAYILLAVAFSVYVIKMKDLYSDNIISLITIKNSMFRVINFSVMPIFMASTIILDEKCRECVYEHKGRIILAITYIVITIIANLLAFKILI